jgi:hypothetical protein
MILQMNLIFGLTSVKFNEFEDESFFGVLWIGDEVKVGHEIRSKIRG